MWQLLKRLFRIFSAKSNAALDSIENPIEMTEEGLRELRKNLDESIKSLAEVKAIAIRTRRDAENQTQLAQDYEVKARALLNKAKNGQLDIEEAKRLAGEALARKEEQLKLAKVSSESLARYDKMAADLEAKVKQLKSQLAAWENELRSLKARHKVSTATQKINKQLANIDSSSTIAMLEKMKEKVEEAESLAESYGEIANQEKSIDAEIDKALDGVKSSASLDSLMAEMGMVEAPEVAQPIEIEVKKPAELDAPEKEMEADKNV